MSKTEKEIVNKMEELLSILVKQREAEEKKDEECEENIDELCNKLHHGIGKVIHDLYDDGLTAKMTSVVLSRILTTLHIECFEDGIEALHKIIDSQVEIYNEDEKEK